MKKKPILGQILYSLNVGNAARRAPQHLTEVTVTLVGRKYFVCGTGWQQVTYHLDDWRQKTIYSAESVLYETREEYERETEVSRKFQALRKHFEYNSPRLPDEVIRKMYACLPCEGPDPLSSGLKPAT